MQLSIKYRKMVKLVSSRKNLLIISLHADPSMPPGVGEWGGTHTYMRELLTEYAGDGTPCVKAI